MYVRETRIEGTPRSRRGNAMVAALVLFVAVAGLVVSSAQLSAIDVRASRRSLAGVRATALAEAGVERTKASLVDAVRKTSVHDPLSGVRALFAGQAVAPMFAGEPMTANGANVGEYTTEMSLDVDTTDRVVVTITSTGYVPRAPQNLGPNQRLLAWDSISVTVEYALDASSVFDNAYFINNWGWLYGSNINVNGNARSNGQMDLGGYAPHIGGSPTYDEIDMSSGAAVLGDRTSDGGLHAAWDIVNAEAGRGIAADTDYHFDFEDPVEMPNLTDLTQYEQRATAAGASITVAGLTVADAVVGDDASESENLYLHGTAADPIVLNGPVVVRGDVVISGVVTGQGTIYSGGNVYVPESVEYQNAPASRRPASNSDGDIAAWLTANQSSDFLGLFARENVVVGDFTNSSWEHYVSGWLASSMNSSDEDAGEDQIPNTAPGRDGVSGTADDDLLEGDGAFTTEFYSAADAASGLIPPGYGVGDRIPGTGEDIDGDGQFDGTLSVTDFEFDDPLDPSHWEGNMPGAGIASYSDVASLYANRLDASFYTNHAFSWVVFGGDDAEVNGAIIARNENIVYGTPNMVVNHDARLLGGNSGIAGDLLPQVLQPMRVLQWRRHESDPFMAQP